LRPKEGGPFGIPEIQAISPRPAVYAFTTSKKVPNEPQMELDQIVKPHLHDAGGASVIHR
jgi:hypothetical protein